MDEINKEERAAAWQARMDAKRQSIRERMAADNKPLRGPDGDRGADGDEGTGGDKGNPGIPWYDTNQLKEAASEVEADATERRAAADARRAAAEARRAEHQARREERMAEIEARRADMLGDRGFMGGGARERMHDPLLRRGRTEESYLARDLSREISRAVSRMQPVEPELIEEYNKAVEAVEQERAEFEQTMRQRRDKTFLDRAREVEGTDEPVNDE